MLQISRYTLKFPNLPAAFDGYKISHLSDFHGRPVFGLLEAVKNMKPDIIVCTGDMFDGVQGYGESALLMSQLVQIAPVYYICGNHEYYHQAYKKIMADLNSFGVRVLKNEQVPLKKDNEEIILTGLDDPSCKHGQNWKEKQAMVLKEAASYPKENEFMITLVHRADLFELLLPFHYDLILSGHLHGGQWRFFNHGLVAPGHDSKFYFFPKYSAGIHKKEKSTMVVSRGLGDQMHIPRVNNRPELIEITLKQKGESNV